MGEEEPRQRHPCLRRRPLQLKSATYLSIRRLLSILGDAPSATRPKGGGGALHLGALSDPKNPTVDSEGSADVARFGKSMQNHAGENVVACSTAGELLWADEESGPRSTEDELALADLQEELMSCIDADESGRDRGFPIRVGLEPHGGRLAVETGEIDLREPGTDDDHKNQEVYLHLKESSTLEKREEILSTEMEAEGEVVGDSVARSSQAPIFGKLVEKCASASREEEGSSLPKDHLVPCTPTLAQPKIITQQNPMLSKTAAIMDIVDTAKEGEVEEGEIMDDGEGSSFNRNNGIGMGKEKILANPATCFSTEKESSRILQSDSSSSGGGVLAQHERVGKPGSGTGHARLLDHANLGTGRVEKLSVGVTSKSKVTESIIPAARRVAQPLDYSDLDLLNQEGGNDEFLGPSIKRDPKGIKNKSKSKVLESLNAVASTEMPDELSVPSKVKKDAEVSGKKKRIMTEERKAKKKITKKRKRAETNKKLGIKRLKIKPVSLPKKVVYCSFYLKGRCQQGSSCKFSHDTVPLTKSQPCKHFACNSCLKGDDCPFDHELGKYPCHNFRSKGSCIRGDACKFSHKISSLENCTEANVRRESLLSADADFTRVMESPKSIKESKIFRKTTPLEAPKGLHFLSFDNSLTRDGNKPPNLSPSAALGLATETLKCQDSMEQCVLVRPNETSTMSMVRPSLSVKSKTSSSMDLQAAIQSSQETVAAGVGKDLIPGLLSDRYAGSAASICGSIPTTSASVNTKRITEETARLLDEFLFHANT